MAEPPEALRIGQLAERAGVTPRTVRYYVAEGLLPPPSGAGQQRVYTQEHLLRLRAIRRLKEAFLPLGEIRQRLAGLSLPELQRLAEAPPSPPSGALEYLAALLPPPPPRPQAPAALREPPRMLAERGHSGPVLAHFRAPPGPLQPPDSTPPGTVWHRVALAPGVELHYQPSGDWQRDAAIARLIRDATRLLATLPPPPRPAP